MGTRSFKPYTPGTRQATISDFSEITKSKVITSRRRGGGHKRLYRFIDFKRDKYDIPGKVVAIEYDPNRNARIALVEYQDGEKRYILAPLGVQVGTEIISGSNSPIEIGNALPLQNIPLGETVHNIELRVGRGGQIVRAAGTAAKVMAKEGDYVTIGLPSKEVRMIRKECYATIGQVGNTEFRNLKLGKAGKTRHLGRRPQVRGSAMNPCDHPHGGGEGRAPIGRSGPVTPWGKPALGLKTRKKKKASDRLIVRRRR